LSNVSSTALGIHVRCGDTDEQITLIPNSTALRDIGSAASANNGPGASIGCDLTSSGPSDSLRADGLITGPNGYGAPIRFYDLTTSTSQALTSVGLDPSAKTYVTVHNVLNQAVTVNPILREASLSAGQEKKLAPVSLDAYSTTSIPIDSKLKLFDVARTSRVSLTLDTSAPTGALVGSVTQIGAEDGIVEDVPLKTSNAAAFARGAYPLRWDGDYSNLIAVANTVDKELKIKACLTAGKVTYIFAETVIESGRTMIYDVDQLRRNGVPDVNGTVIPVDAVYGKFFWNEAAVGTNVGLLGRNSVGSRRNRRKSSFSCPASCAANYDGFPFFDTVNPIEFLPYGSTASAPILEHYTDSTGNQVYPYSYSNINLWADNTSYISYAADGADGASAIVQSGTPGQTTSYFSRTEHYYAFNGYAQICYDNIATSQPSGPSGTNGCPGTVTIDSLFKAQLPSVDHPDSLTGIGILARMLVSPLTADYYGTAIQEVVTPTTNTCPANIAGYASFPNQFSIFHVGDQILGSWEGQPYGYFTNTFYDSHRIELNFSILGLTSVTSCQAQATQVYSCNGNNIGTFLLTNTYTRGTVNGQDVTNIATDKVKIN